MKNRILSILLCAAMLLALIPTALADDTTESGSAAAETTEAYSPFTDIQNSSSYYYDAILWAYYHNPQITGGNTATSFNPNGKCTRGQVVTFLWRAAGEPEPKKSSCSFTDVISGKYYYKAVLWAVEQGITSGYSDGTFRPNQTVTRGQLVMFLWRYAGKPSPKSSVSTFSDVTGGQFYNAILWAAEQGITSGYSDETFRPGDPCKRGQVVTFLYRARTVLGISGEDSANRKADRVEFNYSSGLKESAVIKGYAGSKLLWTKKTSSYEVMQLRQLGDIGICNTQYYYYEGGTVYALSLKDGSVIWKNSDPQVGSITTAFRSNGDLILTGGLEMLLMGIDKNGKTLFRKKPAADTYMWQIITGINGNLVYMDVTRTDWSVLDTECTIAINLTDFSVKEVG